MQTPSTTVICTDKTGTLTPGEFQMTQHLALGQSKQDFLKASVLACERHPTDAMERAIGAYAAVRGVSPANVDALCARPRLRLRFGRQAHVARVARAGIRRTTVFARISPEQKFLIVDALKKDGAIVAMTGDGLYY